MTKENIRPAKLVDSIQPQWYACYTRSRTEKATVTQLAQAGIECYLPLIRTRRKWSDRMKWVDIPLIRSYIFVRVSQDNYPRVLSTDNVVRFITFENKAVPIPDIQIETIRLLLNQGAELEVVSKRFEPGDKVVVQAGPFLGLQGELVQFRGKHKVLIRLGEMSESILVTLPLELLLQDF